MTFNLFIYKSTIPCLQVLQLLKRIFTSLSCVKSFDCNKITDDNTSELSNEKVLLKVTSEKSTFEFSNIWYKGYLKIGRKLYTD